MARHRTRPHRPLLASDTQGTEVCRTTGETITWTQRLSLSGRQPQLQRGQRPVDDLGPVRSGGGDSRGDA